MLHNSQPCGQHFACRVGEQTRLKHHEGFIERDAFLTERALNAYRAHPAGP